MKGLKQVLKQDTIRTVALAFVLSLSAGVYSQHSPADEYYNNNMDTQTPSEAHYNKSLRAGGDEWEEDDGPGGGGDGGNAGVGVPLDNAPYSLLFAGLAYTAFIAHKKYKRTNRTIDK